MNSSYQLFSGLILFFLTVIITPRYKRITYYLGVFFIIYAIINLDINSYQSDLIGYSNIRVFNLNANTKLPILNIPSDIIFYKSTLLLYSFGISLKKIVTCWQLLIVLFIFLSEKISSKISLLLNYRYPIGLLSYFFYSLNIQSIFNQLRFGIFLSLTILGVLILIYSLIDKSRYPKFLPYFIFLFAFGIHGLSTIFLIFTIFSIFILKRFEKSLPSFKELKYSLFSMPITTYVMVIIYMILLIAFSKFVIIYLSTIARTFVFKWSSILVLIEKNSYRGQALTLLSTFYYFILIFYNYFIMKKIRINPINSYSNAFIINSFLYIPFLMLPIGPRLAVIAIPTFIPILSTLGENSKYRITGIFSIIILINNIIRFNSYFPLLN